MEDCPYCKKTVRSNEDKKELINRINRIIGQLNGISKMIQDDRYCQDILIQLSASKSAITSLSSEILDKHLHSCVVQAIKNGDEKVLDEINDLFKKYK